MKFLFSQYFLLLSLLPSGLADITIQMRLAPLSSSGDGTVTQKCLSLPPNHCCVPVDIIEPPPEPPSPTGASLPSLTSTHPSEHERQRYLPIALDIQNTGGEKGAFIWAGTNSYDCAGRPITRVALQTGKQWQKWAPKKDVRVTGFAIDSGDGFQSQGGEKVVTYPREISYKGGLYYEYLTGSLTYAKVSFPGDGPRIIYGLRQGEAGSSRVAGAGSAR
ncbi:MAG: hypothetical protein Q9218_004609 [Villophora microphyllina]